MGQPAYHSASAFSSLFSALPCHFFFPKIGSDRWDKVTQQVPGASKEGKTYVSCANSHP